MTQVVPLSDPKARQAGLVQAAEAGQVVHISRHGKPVAVLLSEEAYSTLYQLQTSQAPREGHPQLAPGGMIWLPRGLAVAIRSVSGSGACLVAGSPPGRPVDLS